MTDIHEEFHVDRLPELLVRVVAGRVRVTEGADDQVIVDVRGHQADRFLVEQSGSQITIRPARDQRVNTSHDVDISCPRDTSLQIKSASSSVSVDGAFGDTNIGTTSGDVRVATVAGELTIKSASADVAVSDPAGRIRISTVSGEVLVSDAPSDISAKTASGDVRLEGALGDATVKSTSGDVSAVGYGGPSFHAKTVSGAVHLQVVAGRTASLNLDSLTGKIELPEERASSATTGPNLEIFAKTITGRITIERAP